MSETINLSSVEKLKTGSRALRGTIEESLRNEITGSLSNDDQTLIKFHGMYQQDDRDQRNERASKKLERLYTFMIRLRLPGGFLTPQQWLATHHIAGEHSTGIIKITTRQTIQLHGLVKTKLKPTLQVFNQVDLDSIAACGDVNRNVVCSSHPQESPVHEQVFAYADKISEMLLPKTRAYYEIWLGDELLIDKKEEEDPLYQDRYLPRKFKIGIAIPPNNDPDIYANDIGLIAIIEHNELKGFNIAIGGGLAFTHGNPDTYPRLGTVIGFVDSEEKTLKAVYEILTVQRDFGNRNDRKLSRLKYTVDKLGVEAFKAELENRIVFKLETARPFAFTHRKDHYGWKQNDHGLWYYTLFIENGRVLDTETLLLKTALLKVAETGNANFRFTCNQNLILSDITDADKAAIDSILEQYQLTGHTDQASAIRKNAIACVAFNTCPLALAEAQRYLPTLLSKIEPLLAKHQLADEEITIRMTGCPNGCGRSALSEIGFIGTAYGHYNLYLGGDYAGTRLNKLYKESLNEAAILAELDNLFGAFSRDRKPGERFGDFTIRKGFVPAF